MAGMQFYGKKVCFIGAHPDDIELGCGALIARISGKTDVRCVTFSNNQKNPLLKKGSPSGLPSLFRVSNRPLEDLSDGRV